jgi:DNA mismatch repair protein MutL
MTIRLLPPAVADRIAAGEVVERPASVVKELTENALDAAARRIAVAIEGGGTARITVEDDGAGIAADELALAVERHATSKLADERLIEIATLGFRGEALPSIGAVARLEIVSRPHGCDAGAAITVEAGAKGAVRPAAAPHGTRVTVRDLFFAAPARLKFLKTARTEAEACAHAVRRLALAHPAVGFAVTLDGREALAAPPADRARRIAALVPDLAAHAVAVAAERGAFALAGVIGSPSLTRATATEQHLMVNGRPVADRLLRTALRVAYGDLIAPGRHPLAVLALTLPPDSVDVNVHPAKAELRFREPDAVRGFVIAALRSALGTARTVAPAPAARWSAPPMRLTAAATALAEAPALPLAAPPLARPVPVAPPPPDHPLGAARAQLLDTYIVAETADGAVVLVDQHAAAERLAHEALRRALETGGVAPQTLLSPEVVELAPAAAEAVRARAEELATLGLAVEPFGGALLVRAVPAPLAGCDAAGLLRDIAEELADTGETTALRVRIDAVLARMACHGSLRAGRRLTQAEMDALLRQIETAPNSGTCSHGRPTWIRLTRAELARLFGRR